MARRLRTVIQTLDLVPDAWVHFEGATVGAMPRTPSDDDVVWDVASVTSPGADSSGAGWHMRQDGLAQGRATLPQDAVSDYITDAVFDVVSNGHRTVRTPIMSAAGLRGWLRIEPLYLEPDAAATVTFRIHDGTDDLYWDGAAWSVASDEATHWTTPAALIANFASLSSGVRSFALVARLSTTDVDYTPSFGGCVVAYGLRDDGDDTDALLRTLRRKLLDEIRPSLVAEWTTTASTAVVDVSDGGEWAYQLTDVLAAYNLTDDPLELAPLSGSFVSPDWTPDTPIDAAKRVRLEGEYSPDVVLQRHRDVVALERLPSIVLTVGDVERSRTSIPAEVRDIDASPPVTYQLGGIATVEADLVVTVGAELGSDVSRITAALNAWLGGSGYRRLVSPESARAVAVQEVEGFRRAVDRLGSGISEARATWRVTYHESGADSLAAVTMTRAGGIAIQIEE